MDSIGGTRWDCPIPTPPKPPAENTRDARVHDARHLRRPKGDCVLLFALSCHDQEAEVLGLVTIMPVESAEVAKTPIRCRMDKADDFGMTGTS